MKGVVYQKKSGEILTRFSIPARTVDNLNTTSDEGILTENDVIFPESLKHKVVDPQAEQFVWDKPLSEFKSHKITEIKNAAQDVLSKTDWYVTRQQETGASIPQDVLDHRSSVRSLSDEFEADVNALESIGEVMDYSFEYPEPPEA